MTAIVRRFQRYGQNKPVRSGNHAYGSEACANNLRREYDEMERDTERVIGQTRQFIERERARDQER